MTEHEPSAEFVTPQRIIERYLALKPTTGLGAIDPALLHDWHERLGNVELEPDQALIAGWISSEYGLATMYGRGEGGSRRAREIFHEAVHRFGAVAGHESPQVDGLLRGQAVLAKGAAQVWRSIASGDSIAESSQHYLSLQAQAGQHILRHGETTGSARAAMMADTLTVVMLMSQKPGDLAFPASPRHISPDVDGFWRHNVFFIEADTGNSYSLRVAQSGPDELIVVPPELLGQERFASASGYGTLDALIQQQEMLDRFQGSAKNIINTKPIIATIRKTSAHTDPVLADFLKHVSEGKARIKNAPPLPPREVNPIEWFREIHPAQNPFVVNSEAVDAAISPLELYLAEDNLSPRLTMELGWMYAEVALGRAINPDTKSYEIRGDIARSEEVLGMAMAKFEAPEDSLAFCEASFGFSSLALYEAVLCGDEITDEMRAAYYESLVRLGRRAIARHESLKDKKSVEAKELDAFVQRITLCLLVFAEGGGAYAALPATPRQQGVGGWDVNVWSETIDGFVPGRYGRLRVAEKVSRYTLAEGIVTVTPTQLYQKSANKRFVTFTALADEWEDVPLPPKTAADARHKQVARAWDQTSRAVEAAEV